MTKNPLLTTDLSGGRSVSVAHPLSWGLAREGGFGTAALEADDLTYPVMLKKSNVRICPVTQKEYHSQRT